jgi:ferredoxin-NADP reductase
MAAPGVRRVRFRMLEPDRLGHRAGQYIILHARAGDGTAVKRAYSLASPPAEDPEFCLCVRRIPERPASGFVHGVATGTEVSFTGPWGKFVVDDRQRDLVLVCTGTGMSPIGAILEDEIVRPGRRRIRLLWGLRRASDIHGASRLETLAAAHPRFSYTIALSRAADGSPGFRGRVTDLLAAEAGLDRLFYLAGNGAMIADAEDILAAAGVPAEAVRKEVFFTPGRVRVPLRERQRRQANRQRAGTVVAGLALHAGTPAGEVLAALAAALAAAGLPVSAVRNLAAKAQASDEPGLRATAEALALPVEFYMPAELEQAPDPTGAKSGCEALALLSAGGAHLIQAKWKTPAVTVALAAVEGGSRVAQ